jgi:hypothetical protein
LIKLFGLEQGDHDIAVQVRIARQVDLLLASMAD